MANINELLARAAALRDETQLNSISPERAGGIMYETLLALNELWLQQGAALVISKIYASVAAMEADTSPVSDLTGKPIRPGMVVVIASSDSDNGSVYRYNGTSSPRWSLVGEIGNLEPVDSLDSDSTSLPLAAHQGKVLDGKISQLGQGKVFQNGEISLTASTNTDLTGFPTNKTISIRVEPTDPSITQWNYLSLSVYAGGWQNLGQIKNRKFHYFDIPSNAVRVVLSTGSAFTAMTADVFATYDVEIPASTQIAVEGLEAELDKKLDFTKPQTLSDAQKAQALGNLGIGIDAVPTQSSDNLVKSGGIYNALASQKEEIDVAISGRVKNSYGNILIKSQVLDGSAYAASASIVENSNWVGRFGTIQLPWLNEDKITVSNVNATSSCYCHQFDANGVRIDSAMITGISGEYTFTRASGAVTLGLTVRSSDISLRANYGAILLPYTNDNIGSPIAGYLVETNKKIDGTYNILYAYADGDSTPDDATHFYGWKNGVCSIQRAIDLAKNYTKIYCKGIFNVTGTSQFILQEDGLYNVVFIPHTKIGIEIIGESPDKTVLNVRMPDNFASIASYQPIGIFGDKCVIKNLGVFSKNARYCIHIDASHTTVSNGYTIKIKNCVLRHYANDGGGFEAPLGPAPSDGMTLIVENTTLITGTSYNPPLTTHDNIHFNEGSHWIIRNCNLITPEVGSPGSPESTNVNNAVQLMTIQAHGSEVENVITVENNEIGSCKPLFINQPQQRETKTLLSEFVPKVFIKVNGFMNQPYGYQTSKLSDASIPGVLRVTSKSTGATSVVRFDKTSSAFDILVKGNLATGFTDIYGNVHTDGYHYNDGTTGLHGYAMGELALDTGRICSMQNRLGDCTGTNKVLGVSVDGVDYTITFNQNYTSYSDADMLAVFTDVLGEVADVELYNWARDYFPEIEPSYSIQKNNNNYVISKGMGVKLTGAGMRKATTDEEVDAICIDNVKPGYMGRCCSKVMLSIYEEDAHHIFLVTYPTTVNDRYTSAFAADFGIDPENPGAFVKTTGGVLKFKYYGYLILDK